jgi:hypothetical protein
MLGVTVLASLLHIQEAPNSACVFVPHAVVMYCPPVLLAPWYSSVPDGTLNEATAPHASVPMIMSLVQLAHCCSIVPHATVPRASVPMVMSDGLPQTLQAAECKRSYVEVLESAMRKWWYYTVHCENTCRMSRGVINECTCFYIYTIIFKVYLFNDVLISELAQPH